MHWFLLVLVLQALKDLRNPTRTYRLHHWRQVRYWFLLRVVLWFLKRMVQVERRCRCLINIDELHFNRCFGSRTLMITSASSCCALHRNPCYWNEALFLPHSGALHCLRVHSFAFLNASHYLWEILLRFHLLVLLHALGQKLVLIFWWGVSRPIHHFLSCLSSCCLRRKRILNYSFPLLSKSRVETAVLRAI